MGALSIFALIMLVLVGYSGGSVLGRAGRIPLPTPIDLVIVAALWTLAFWIRPSAGKWWAIVFGVAMALAVGIAVAAIRGKSIFPRRRHVQAAAARSGSAPSSGPLGWWRRFANELGNFQGRLVMAFLYFGFVTPFALLGGRSRKTGRLVAAADGSRWRIRKSTSSNLESAKRQF
jgi:hypothetical protein